MSSYHKLMLGAFVAFLGFLTLWSAFYFAAIVGQNRARALQACIEQIKDAELCERVVYGVPK